MPQNHEDDLNNLWIFLDFVVEIGCHWVDIPFFLKNFNQFANFQDRKFIFWLFLPVAALFFDGGLVGANNRLFLIFDEIELGFKSRFILYKLSDIIQKHLVLFLFPFFLEELHFAHDVVKQTLGDFAIFAHGINADNKFFQFCVVLEILYHWRVVLYFLQYSFKFVHFLFQGSMLSDRICVFFIDFMIFIFSLGFFIKSTCFCLFFFELFFNISFVLSVCFEITNTFVESLCEEAAFYFEGEATKTT